MPNIRANLPADLRNHWSSEPVDHQRPEKSPAHGILNLTSIQENLLINIGMNLYLQNFWQSGEEILKIKKERLVKRCTKKVFKNIAFHKSVTWWRDSAHCSGRKTGGEKVLILKPPVKPERPFWTSEPLNHSVWLYTLQVAMEVESFSKHSGQ